MTVREAGVGTLVAKHQGFCFFSGVSRRYCVWFRFTCKYEKIPRPSNIQVDSGCYHRLYVHFAILGVLYFP